MRLSLTRGTLIRRKRWAEHRGRDYYSPYWQGRLLAIVLLAIAVTAGFHFVLPAMNQAGFERAAIHSVGRTSAPGASNQPWGVTLSDISSESRPAGSSDRVRLAYDDLPLSFEANVRSNKGSREIPGERAWIPTRPAAQRSRPSSGRAAPSRPARWMGAATPAFVSNGGARVKQKSGLHQAAPVRSCVISANARRGRTRGEGIVFHREPAGPVASERSEFRKGALRRRVSRN